MFVVISYDIENNRKRTKVHKFLSNYGFPIQLSVFECYLNNEQLNSVKTILEEFDFTGDNLRIYVLCQTCTFKVMALGDKSLTKEPDKFII